MLFKSPCLKSCSIGNLDFVFNRGEETEAEQEMLKNYQVTNPDEINLDDDFESDEEEKIEGIDFYFGQKFYNFMVLQSCIYPTYYLLSHFLTVKTPER